MSQRDGKRKFYVILMQLGPDEKFIGYVCVLGVYSGTYNLIML